VIRGDPAAADQHTQLDRCPSCEPQCARHVEERLVQASTVRQRRQLAKLANTPEKTPVDVESSAAGTRPGTFGRARDVGIAEYATTNGEQEKLGGTHTPRGPIPPTTSRRSRN